MLGFATFGIFILSYDKAKFCWCRHMFFVWILESLYIDKKSRMFRHYNAGQAAKHEEYEQWLKEDLKQRKEETRKYKQRQKLEKKQKIEETKEAKEVKNTMQKSDLF